MTKVLVTGGAGFIGSHLIDRLLADGCHVTVADNFDPFYGRAIKIANLCHHFGRPEFRLCEADICGADLVRYLEHETFDAVVHLAAKAGVRPSIADPQGYVRVNVGGTAAVLELARQLEIKKVVFASSSSVYGANPRLPWNEADCDVRPISPYAQSKISGEMLGHVYSHLYGMRFVGLRFFTVYGPRQRPDLAFHKFAGRLVRGEAISMFGNGSTSRDYTYVSDIVQGICAALRYEDSIYEIFNLGSGRPVQLLRMLTSLEQSLGVEARVERHPEQPGDVRETYADIAKARRLLDYEPAVSLESGIRRFVEWFQASGGNDAAQSFNAPLMERQPILNAQGLEC